MPNANSSWDSFCDQYFKQAMSSAKYHLDNIKNKSSYWDNRIDEDAIVGDAVSVALEKAFLSFDPSRGTKPTTLLLNIVHNEVVNALRRETKELAHQRDMTARQEKEYTISQMVERIPDDSMDNLIQKLREAIMQLPPIEQGILDFYLADPRSYIDKSVAALHMAPNAVSVRKNRALKRLPDLMGVSRKEYVDLYEERPTIGLVQNKVRAAGVFINPIYSQFDLDGTVSRLYNVLNEARGE